MADRQTRQLRLILIYLLIAAPFILLGAARSLQSNANSPLDWVPATFAPRAEYDAFCRAFGPGDTVVASWDGCTLDEPKLDALCHELRQSPSFRSGETWLFERVVSGREVLENLTAGPAPVAAGEVSRRFRGSLIGPDGRTTCVVITLTATGLRQRERLVASIQDEIERTCGVARSAQHLAGPVIDGLSVDVASRTALDRLGLPSALVVLVAACVCLRSVRAGLFVFGLSVFCQAATLALLHFSGETMSALLIVLPPLIQVLAVAGGIHLANYYFDAVPSHGVQGASAEAVRRGWLPCLLSSGTTVVGMASLMASQLLPIRSFGAYSAAGLTLTTVLLLTMLPALLATWPPRRRPVASGIPEDAAPRSGAIWAPLTEFLSRYHLEAVAVAVLLMAGCGLGLRHLTTSVRIQTLFAADSRIIQDYAWLEQHIGPLVPIEVVVSCDENCRLALRERLLLLWKLAQAASRDKAVGGTLSAVELLPAFPDPGSLPPGAYEPLVAEILEASRPGFIQSARLHMEGSQEQWRLTVYVSSLSNIDYGQFLVRLQQRLDPVLREALGTAATGVSTHYTGIMPLVHEIQRQLMRNLFQSFLSALAVIVLVMIVAQAGVAAGLVAMIPNVFPSLIVFGLWGWTHASLDIGTVMTASIALGMAIDDTLHYLTFFQRGLALGRNRRDCVLWSYQHCGPAMFQTSLICGLGLSLFWVSDFLPTSRFAGMMVALITLALIGDLVLLPTLLLGPLGRLFLPSQEAIESAPPQSSIRGRTPVRRREECPVACADAGG